MPIESLTCTRESLEDLFNDEVIVDYESATVAGGLDESDTDTHASPVLSRPDLNPFPEQSVSNAQSALHEVTPLEPFFITNRLDEHQQNIIDVKKSLGGLHYSI